MAVTMAEITKLRKMTGAGMMDCKNALNEAEGDIDKAMEIIRKKGQAVAAKRSDRDASEGCVLAKADGNFAAIIALKCETDFVANNADFVKLTQDILDLAVLTCGLLATQRSAQEATLFSGRSALKISSTSGAKDANAPPLIGSIMIIGMFSFSHKA